MPLYSYHCDKCGRDSELFNTVENREYATCGTCFERMTKVLSNIAKPVVLNYYSEALGAHITGPKQKSQVMKEKNVSEVGKL